jgi:hypothetical protein
MLLLGSLLLGSPSMAQTPALPSPSSSQPLPLPALPPAAPLTPPSSTPSTEQPAPAEQLTTFDGQAARLEWVNNRWQILANGLVLKDFGRRDAEARQALRLIQELGLTQRGTVGRPAPVMEYWLASGQGPQGLTTGLRRLPLDLASLRVEQVQAQWCLRDDQRVLFNFGRYPGEARRALAILRKYHFTQVGLIGQATPSMMIFLSGSEDDATGGPTSLTPSRIHKASSRTGPGKRERPADGMFGAGVTVAVPALHEGDSGLRKAHPIVFKGEQDRPNRRDGRGPGLSGWDERGEWVPFDWRQVQVRQEEGVWKLAAGPYMLASFGIEEEAARQALAAVRHYHFTEHCRVGQPVPVFSYFLVSGQAPRGMLFGLSGQAFEPDRLSVEALGRQWAICSGDQVLLLLGEDADEAHRLLEAIRRNQFDHLCRIGPSEKESMTFFVRVH